MSRSSTPKSEAFCSRTVCKDGVVQLAVQCIGSGDDLDPFLVGFGCRDWVGVDRCLTGEYFFSLRSRLARGREEETSVSRSLPRRFCSILTFGGTLEKSVRLDRKIRTSESHERVESLPHNNSDIE